MDKKRFPILLINALCPICGVVHASGVGVGTEALPINEAEKLESNREPSSYELCEYCKEHIDMGYIGIIEIDSLLSVDDSNPYRTGRSIWLRFRVFLELFDEALHEPVKKRKSVYVDEKLFQFLEGLTKTTNDGDSPAENGV